MSIYTRFTNDDIVPSSQTIVTTGLWSGDTGSLEGNALFLYDTQTGKSGEYYFDVYDTNPNPGGSDSAEVQFAIAYGHVSGGGAPTLADNEQSKLPTKAIYSQYRSLCLGPTDNKFSFNGVSSDHIYVINMQRARVREQLDPGNWQLPLSGANGVRTFIDDSNETLEAATTTTTAGRVFKVVSGSFDSVSGSIVVTATASNGAGFGLSYPDLGIIILNPDAICPTVGFYVSGSDAGTAGALTTSGSNTVGSSLTGSATNGPVYKSTNLSALDSQVCIPFAPLTRSIADTEWGTEKSAYNQAALFTAIKNAITPETFEFKARSAETISSTHYFVRLRSSQYNYSNNSTFRDNNGVIKFASFKSDPRVYVTTVGLYNDSNELLAVAKLSKPLRKSFTEEILLRVRLDF